jgi:nucleoside-triphosphatase
MAHLTLVIGPKGAGKTSWCVRRIARAKANDRQISGLLSPGRYQDSSKVGIDLECIATGERRHLGVVSTRGGEYPALTLPVGQWLFDPKVIDWGNKALESLGPQDLFIFDELGPLEFQSNAGLQAVFEVIERGMFQEAYVVVRGDLVDQAILRWPTAEIIRIQGGSGEGNDLAY